MSDIRRRQFLTVADLEKEDLEHWDWPDYEKDAPEKETAIGYSASRSQNESVDGIVEDDVSPLTVQELDELHQQAKDEGFAIGKEEGFAAGKEEGIAQGIEEGKEQGHAQGYAEGYAVGQNKVNEEVAKMVTLFEKLAYPVNQVDQEVENQLIEMTLLLVKEVINVELKSNPQIILSSLREVIKSLPMSEQSVDIYLHPDDLSIVEQHYDKDAQSERKWRLIGEPQMNVGDIQAQCRQSQVEYNMQDRVTHFMRQFSAANSQVNKSANIVVVNHQADQSDSMSIENQGHSDDLSAESAEEL